MIIHGLGVRIGLRKKKADVYDDDEDDTGIQLVPTERRPYVVTSDGLAVINVFGSLVRRGDMVSAVSGLTTYPQLEDEFLDAVTNPAVKGILLDIDSPGGEAGGVFDLADQIYSQRGQKPIYAIADENMYSAAYAIGSAADKVFVSRTGGVGSVGVICLHVDTSEAEKDAGIKYTAIYAGDHKNDLSPHQPLDKEARQTVQEEVDRLGDVFVETVARNRGMSAASVRNTQAGCFFGPLAVNIGFADQVGNFADALSALGQATTQTDAPAPKSVFNIAGTSVAANSNEGGEVKLLANPTTSADPIPVDNPTTEQHQPQARQCAQCFAPLAETANYCSSCGLNEKATAQPILTVAAPLSVPTTNANSEAVEIMSLCDIAHRPLADALAYIERGMSAKQVMKDLQTQRARTSDQDPIVSTVVPQTGTQHGKPDMSKTENNLLLQVVEDEYRNAGPRLLRRGVN